SSGLHLVLRGYEEGSFTLDVEETEGDTTIASTTFSGIPASGDTVATLNVLPNTGVGGISPLALDENGDGAADKIILPNLGGEASYSDTYRFDGFLQPINDTTHDPNQTPSIFKAGSTVPVKFQLKNWDGAVVQASTSPVWTTPKREDAMNASATELSTSVSATSGSTYRWDDANQQYIYNWSTKGLSAGYWYRVYAKLDDGNTYSVVVGLR
ncbi:MAG: PxKF domain-containing protein, partial [Nitrososphaera sp.]|nr:PxKF domain-containing protein [Nitrososphaera sp.]